MIISKNIHPERDLYYLGGKVIEVLSSSKGVEYDYFDLYAHVKSIQPISFNLYMQVIDWLFIIGTISNGKNGFIEKCF